MSYLKSLLSLTIASTVFSTAFSAQASTPTYSFAANPLEQDGKTEQVSVSFKIFKDKSRSFTLTSTQQQRDNKEKIRVINEAQFAPKIYSNSPLFDALFSLAIDDMKQDSVKAIRDYNYNNGEAIPCDCFETGEKWNYVWTRDLSYAANLGLAHLDPQRVVNSLLFKVSGFREGVKIPADIPADSLQIVQDTGSGGSWPVSTDRVTWTLAAKSVLQSLHGAAREAFAVKAYAALRGTIAADRAAAFDERTGLYGGEHSYLDWRTQTYAPWIVNNLSRMSESKALSTNLLHFATLQLAADLALEKGDKPQAEKYQQWAASLKQKINDTFWQKQAGLYSTMTVSGEDPAALFKYDMLGNALAIIVGVASESQGQKIIASYPNTPLGVPVYYPQQPNIFVYHNRSMWPFVTAYALKAAVQVGNYTAADNALQSLVRGSALNLSNMENLEWLTGKPFYDDGPEINSRRQLWSVGAYAGMAIGTVFGVQYQTDGLVVKPFLTNKTLALLGGGKQASLDNLKYKNHTISVQLNLPAAVNRDGVYSLASVTLNNKPVSGVIAQEQLTAANNIIRVSFGELSSSAQSITSAENVNPLSHTDAKVFSPEAPIAVTLKSKRGETLVEFSNAVNQPAENLVYNIYKNGKLKASHIKTLSWVDDESLDPELRSCYTVESEYLSSGNKSHHSEPVCLDGSAQQFIKVTDKRVASNIKPLLDNEHFAEAVLHEWGAQGDSLQFNKITFKAKGTYAIQVVYNNRQHTIDSGVTNAVKTLSLLNAKGELVRQGVVQMPNVQDRDNRYPLNTSTEFKVDVDKGRYQLVFGDYFNMSYLQANSTYRPTGGASGAVNKASIAGIKIVRLD
ncbi:MAG TPA: amylo-alpha-1,6-glucosidase [Cellvibrio sp.]|nr:amylo-alpha-1,6-glucosidase [Cellvibrio sp.]